MEPIINWLKQDLPTRLPILVAVIAVAGTIIGGLFTVVVWPFLKIGLEYLWDKISGHLSGKNFENRYLEWVINEHKNLPTLPTTLVPVTERRVQELDKLYVSLSVTDGSNQSNESSLGDNLVNHPSLVILGDPGAGKTTMLRFLALTFGRARRNKSAYKKVVERKRDAALIKLARNRVKAELKFEIYPLPIFVYLNRLKDVATWPSNRSLLDTLREEWKSIDTLRDFPEDFFDEKLRAGQCVFLFDAFDELGSQEARAKIAEHIGQLVSSVPRGNKFIVTSRIVGYNGQLAQYGFHILTIQKLSWPLIAELIGKWYEFLEKKSLGEQLLNTFKAKPRIYDLAVNPMLLSLIVLVQYVRGLIPDKRHVLYDECIKILVERRFAPVEVQEGYNKVLPSDEAIRILRDITLRMHMLSLREVTRAALEHDFIPAALVAMPLSKALTVPSLEILRNIEQRSQLLVERGLNEKGEPVMAFSHLTFQEYLTSVALKESIGQKTESDVSANLIQSYEGNPKWWEEVALLYAAQLEGAQRQDFFNRVYPNTVNLE